MNDNIEFLQLKEVLHSLTDSLGEVKAYILHINAEKPPEGGDGLCVPQESPALRRQR